MKTVLDYAVRYTRAPGETKDTAVPFIVERNQATDLETIVENCIDRGLIAGLKPTAAHGIAEGVAEQLAREFSLGRSISFGQYFYGRPYLQGTVGADGRLTAANGITVRLAKGNDFKLSLDDFTLRFNDGGNTPKIEFVLDNPTRTRGVLTAGEGGQIHGFMLYAAGDANKVVFSGAAGTATEVTAFDKQGAQLLEFTVPDLAAGTYSVKVQRIDENGIVRETTAKTVTVKAAATPPPEPIAETEDGQVKIMSITDGGQSETFTTGDTWTATGEGFLGSEADWTVDAANVRSGPGTDAVISSVNVTSATELEVRCNPAGEIDAGDYPNATLELVVAHFTPSGEHSETLIIPIHLVVE